MADCGALGAIMRTSDYSFQFESEFSIDKRVSTLGNIELALVACVGHRDYSMQRSDAGALVVNQTLQLTSIQTRRQIRHESIMGLGVILWTESFLNNLGQVHVPTLHRRDARP